MKSTDRASHRQHSDSMQQDQKKTKREHGQSDRCGAIMHESPEPAANFGRKVSQEFDSLHHAGCLNDAGVVQHVSCCLS